MHTFLYFTQSVAGTERNQTTVTWQNMGQQAIAHVSVGYVSYTLMKEDVNDLVKTKRATALEQKTMCTLYV